MRQFNLFQPQRLSRLGAAIALAALACLALFGAIAAQDGEGAIVRSQPPAVSLTQGQTTTVSFLIENVSGLYGADVRASFDAASLEVVDSDAAKPDTQVAPGVFLKPDFVVRSVADNGAGTIWYASTQVSPTLPVSGTGALFTAVLRAKADVADSPIVITYAKLVDRNGTELPTTVVSGTAVATTGSAPAATATAATAVPASTTAAPVTATAAPTQDAPAPTSAPANPTPQTASQSPFCAPPGFLLLPLGAVLAGVVAWVGVRKGRQG